MGIIQKRCACCRETKPVEEFGARANNSDGLHEYCKPCSRAKARKYYHAGGERVRLRHAESRRRWVERNPERHQEFYTYYRQLQRLAETAPEADKGITLEEVYDMCGGMCFICFQECSVEEASIDHERPIARGGSHTWDNVQLAHKSCNLQKGARWTSADGDVSVQLQRVEIGDDDTVAVLEARFLPSHLQPRTEE